MERLLPSRTLLLVEDDASLAACATEFLARQGLEVVPAFDLSSALQRLPTKPWDAVVTDLDLTGRRTTDGLQVVAAAGIRMLLAACPNASCRPASEHASQPGQAVSVFATASIALSPAPKRAIASRCRSSSPYGR